MKIADINKKNNGGDNEVIQEFIDYLLNQVGDLVEKSNFILNTDAFPFDAQKNKKDFEGDLDNITRIINDRLKLFKTNQEFLNRQKEVVDNYRNKNNKSIQDGFDLYYDLINLIEEYITLSDILEFKKNKQ